MTQVPAGRADAAAPAGNHERAAPDTRGAADSWPVILSGRRGRLLAGLVLTELVVAVQILIVVTVLPAVVRQVGGIRLYGLALSAAAIAGIGAAPAATSLLDRFGARVVVPAGALAFGSGALGAGLAGSMQALVAARLLEGAGAAALGAIALSGIAALYDETARPKVMVLGNLAWVLPSVAGPALGSLAVATVGWRWAFTAALPLLAVAMALVAPGLRLLPPAGTRAAGTRAAGTAPGGTAPAGRPASITLPSAVLVAALLAVLGGLSEGGAAGLTVAVTGVPVAAWAARRIMPRGMFLARRGLPAITMAMFCCSFAFFAVDGFVPLLLTAVDRRSVSAAGIVVTLAVLSWTVGGTVQARLARRGWLPPRLMTVGAALILAGIAGTSLGLIRGAWLAPYLAWAAGGFGMGLAYTGAWLAAMTAQRDPGGQTATVLAAPLAADRSGTALGAGAGGAGIAVTAHSGLSLGTGIGLSLAVAAVAACALCAAARRAG